LREHRLAFVCTIEDDREIEIVKGYRRPHYTVSDQAELSGRKSFLVSRSVRSNLIPPVVCANNDIFKKLRFIFRSLTSIKNRLEAPQTPLLITDQSNHSIDIFQVGVQID